MKKLLLLLSISCFALTGCFGSRKISKDQCQEEINKLKRHLYSSATVTITRTSKTTGDIGNATQFPNRESYYIYRADLDKWDFLHGDVQLKEAFEPQTLYGRNLDEIMDPKYEYTFYASPIKAHMERENETDVAYQKFQYDWKYNKYGYLTNVSFKGYYKYDYGTVTIKETYKYSYK